MNTEDRILEPGQMETPAGEIRFLFLPAPDLFATRAGRLRQLSTSHPLGDYLEFLALLADAQQEVLNRIPVPPLPDLHERAICRKHGLPLLDTHSRPGSRAWRKALTMILERMKEAPLPDAAQATLAGLMRKNETALEEIADLILAGELTTVSPAELPFIAAALQVYWVKMASEVGEDAFFRLKQGGLCPVCGSYPNIAVVGSSDAEKGLRYLSCSLCSSRWHMVRLTCSNCESTSELGHYIVEGTNGTVKAESCDQCGFYLKLLYLEKDIRMDAIADDLATLGLDMLMEREGKLRRGPNLFFHPGGT